MSSRPPLFLHSRHRARTWRQGACVCRPTEIKLNSLRLRGSGNFLCRMRRSVVIKKGHNLDWRRPTAKCGNRSLIFSVSLFECRLRLLLSNSTLRSFGACLFCRFSILRGSRVFVQFRLIRLDLRLRCTCRCSGVEPYSFRSLPSSVLIRCFGAIDLVGKSPSGQGRRYSSNNRADTVTSDLGLLNKA